MKPAAVLILAGALLLGACGGSGSPFASVGTSEAAGLACGYYDVEGCAVYGLVLPTPLPTAAALAAVAGLPGVAVALWRSDFACVLDITMGPPGEPVPTYPSRFAYVDAAGIRARRMDTEGSLAPPITGLHISQSYWNHWEDQWAQAQEEGVLIEAVAVYLPREFVADGPPSGFRVMVRLPWRRTDTLDPALYAGELLLESEMFPAGYLSSPAEPACATE
ncbi:MAG: hypothetical protein FJW79_07080 [Actinobacteria bacterium]|nr:hypothetical protein [Actinomycetota bacterium]